MEARKQNVSDRKEGAGGASKNAAGRKQSGSESSASPAQGTSPNQGTQSNQGASSPNQGATSNNQGGNQPPAGQNAGDHLLQHAKQATGAIASKMQEQAGTQIARQKESAVTELSQVVDAVRRFGESLGSEESGPIARYAAQYGDKAADSLERLTTYIREQDGKKLLSDVQNFGRRQPALLLGGAFLLGFAGARLIRSAMDAESGQSFHADVPNRKPSTANVPGATPLTKKTPAATPSTPNADAGRPSTSPNAL